MIDYREFSNERNAFIPMEEIKVEEVVDEVEDVKVEETEDLLEAKVGESRIYLREKPSKKSKDLAILEPCEDLLVDATEYYDEWYHVYTASSQEGYVMKHLVNTL